LAGITNYPIGIGINAAGEVTIADYNNHKLNLSIFSQDGQLLNALESTIKHEQLFDMAVMEDGNVVLSSKDNHFYIYRYLPVLPLGIGRLERREEGALDRQDIYPPLRV